MAVITISRMFGAGGRTLGQKIADELGYTFADTEIIQKIAREANVSVGWVESIEKEAGGKMSRIVSSMLNRTLLDRILKGERGYIDEEIYLDYLVVIISQMAEEGNVVILGRGSQYILNDHPDAHHFLLVDNEQNRIRFLMENYKLPREKAATVVKNQDARRRTFYQKLGKQNFDDPALYHMVLNMGMLTMDEAKDLVVARVKGK